MSQGDLIRKLRSHGVALLADGVMRCTACGTQWIVFPGSGRQRRQQGFWYCPRECNGRAKHRRPSLRIIEQRELPTVPAAPSDSLAKLRRAAAEFERRLIS
jgi:hypothetical protein